MTPSNMGGWAFTNDQTGAACTTTALCALVAGPTGMPHGSGSAELATQASTDGIAIGRAGYLGTRLDQLTELSYSTYRQSVNTGNNLAIALQLNVDYDLADADSSYQGRLVYEPYRTVPGGVSQGTWQRWDTRAGKWWGTRATVKKNGASVSNPCVQASPCTWTQALGIFPNLGIHKVYGAVVMKAGSGWAAFRGNVDALSIGVGGATTTFDFESISPMPMSPPIGTSQAVLDSARAAANLLDNPPGIGGIVTRHTLFVRFQLSATLADKEAALALINAEVIGGMYVGPADAVGAYHIRLRQGVAVPPDSATGPLLRARNALRALPSVKTVNFDRIDSYVDIMYRRPIDGAGFDSWKLSPDSADGHNWHLEAINAPFAWGCDNGLNRPGIVGDSQS